MKFLKRLFKKPVKRESILLSYPVVFREETKSFYETLASKCPPGQKWDAMELFMNQVSRRITDEQQRRTIYGKTLAAYTLAVDPNAALVGCINDIGYTILEGLEHETQPG